MGFFNHRKTQFNSNDTNQGPEDTIRYPPTSTPPTGMTGIKEIREKFNKRNASLMPNLEDFNQMFRQYADGLLHACLLYTSPSPRDAHESRMPSSA